jgi:hypothetical protein
MFGHSDNTRKEEQMNEGVQLLALGWELAEHMQFGERGGLKWLENEHREQNR